MIYVVMETDYILHRNTHRCLLGIIAKEVIMERKTRFGWTTMQQIIERELIKKKERVHK